MANKMVIRILVFMVTATIACAAIYGTRVYLVEQSLKLFRANISVVRDNLKIASNKINVSANMLDNLIAILPQVRQEDFAKVTDSLVTHHDYIASITYYRYFEQAERDQAESIYEDGVIATSPEDTDEIVSAPPAPNYLLSHAANSHHFEDIYTGWNLFSDSNSGALARQAIVSKTQMVSNPFLDDEGNSNIDILIPNIDQNGIVKGLVTITANITKLLGPEEARHGFTTKVFVPLRDSSELKNVLTSRINVKQGSYAVGNFFEDMTVNLSSVDIKVEFTKSFYLSEISIILILTLIFAGVSFIWLSMYLLITLQRLSESLKVIEEQNQNLEIKVVERTTMLLEKTEEINTMFQSLPQGIFAIKQDLSIQPQYSKHLELILELTQIAGISFQDLITGKMVGSQEDLDIIISSLDFMIDSHVLNYIANSDHLPREVTLLVGKKEKIIEVTWSPVVAENDIVSKMIVSIRDVTMLRALERKNQEQRDQIELIQQIIVQPRQRFELVTSSCAELLTNARKHLDIAFCQTQTSIAVANSKEQLFRDLHTIKGNCRTAGLTKLSNVVHEVETEMEELKKSEEVPSDVDPYHAMLDRIDAARTKYIDVAANILGRKETDGSQNIYVDRSVVEDLIKTIRINPFPRSDTFDYFFTELLNGNLFCLSDTFNSIVDNSLESMAASVNKDAPIVNQELPHVFLTREDFKIVELIFPHLLTNALAHGIESKEVRLAKNKPPRGRINIECQIDDCRLNMVYWDDGGGLNMNKLRGISSVKAESGDSEIAQAIFGYGVSTADSITEAAGRGVGLDAIQKVLEERGGSALIELTWGQEGDLYRGFRIVINFPIKSGVVYNNKIEMAA